MTVHADSRLDVFAAGLLCVDHIYRVENLPSPDQKCKAQGYRCSGGGPATNAAVTVARLGGKVALATAVGNDVAGQAVMKELANEGIQTSSITTIKEETASSACIVDAEGSRTIISHRPQGNTLNPLELARLQAKVILLDGHRPEWSHQLLSWAEDQGAKTVLDGGSLRSETVELLHRVDYPVLSASFACAWAATDSPHVAFEQLCRQFRCVAVTTGKDGVLYQHPVQGQGHIPALPINTVDTTGAGDIFHGAFAYAIAQALDFVTALRYASVVAANACEKEGSWESIPTLPEVRTWLKRKELAGISLGLSSLFLC